MAVGAGESWVLQLCHGYDGPFLDCARQYAVAFRSTEFKVCTVYLTGKPSEEVERGSASDEVLFLGYSGRDLRGLKLRAIRDVRQLMAGRRFRICIAHRFKPTYVALFATGLPVLSVNHAFGVYQRPMRRLLANVFRSRLTLLGVSQAVRDDLRSCLPGWEAMRIQHLYNRIDLEASTSLLRNRAEARDILGLPPDSWVIGNVGRLHPDKDQSTLLRGFAQALPGLPPRSLLVILGRGKLESELRQLASELGISEKVFFLGQIPNARQLFAAFDVFVLSSDHEPFGMVLLEAMVAGVPLISTDAGGAREVVQSVGQLFPLRDPSALAKCLIIRAEMGANELARTRLAMRTLLADSFSDSAVSPRLVDLATRTIGLSPGSSE
ncbi:glycosyltransferase [Pseudomonas sp.]|jgi:glycosyltransferase involved in cell wall biosynthesis|uniref:glycosyltransferase n=1 Tax=Pseudomonas sp. TaxID=306 RepID=UPI00272A1144|nr:glycosyltransferase [Pseudomonas sp.]